MLGLEDKRRVLSGACLCLAACGFTQPGPPGYLKGDLPVKISNARAPKSNRICWFSAATPDGQGANNSWFQDGHHPLSGPGDGKSASFAVRPGTYHVVITSCIGDSTGSHDESAGDAALAVSGPTEIVFVTPGAQAPAQASEPGYTLAVVQGGPWVHKAIQSCHINADGSEDCFAPQ